MISSWRTTERHHLSTSPQFFSTLHPGSQSLQRFITHHTLHFTQHPHPVQETSPFTHSHTASHFLPALSFPPKSSFGSSSLLCLCLALKPSTSNQLQHLTRLGLTPPLLFPVHTPTCLKDRGQHHHPSPFHITTIHVPPLFPPTKSALYSTYQLTHFMFHPHRYIHTIKSPI